MRYWEGFAAAIAAIAAALQLLAAWLLLGGLRRTYAEFTTDAPLATRLAISPIWAMAVAAAILVALVVARQITGERARTRTTAAIAMIAVALVGLGIWAAYLPMFQLSGSVAAE